MNIILWGLCLKNAKKKKKKKKKQFNTSFDILIKLDKTLNKNRIILWCDTTKYASWSNHICLFYECHKQKTADACVTITGINLLFPGFPCLQALLPKETIIICLANAY